MPAHFERPNTHQPLVFAVHRALITAALKVRGFTQARIAQQLAVPASNVCDVIAGRQRSRRIEEAIVEATGLAHAVLWPQHHGLPAINPDNSA